MMKKNILFILLITPIILLSQENTEKEIQIKTDGYSGSTKKYEIQYKQEIHLKNIKQLTFGGDNAEAYFSFDNTKLVFQLKNKDIGIDCDQIYVTNWKEDNMKETLPIW